MPKPRFARPIPPKRKARTRSRWAPWATAILIIAATLHGGGQLASGAGGAAKIGSPAPDFTLHLLNGKSITLSSLKGKPVVVNFWHSG